MKILVVEDTEDSRVLLVDQLEVQGYEVESAVNGVEALDKACTSPPDVIISDILMPEMDGFELCRKVKKVPQLRNIPFIFYTATYTEISDQNLALSMGATRFIIKPEDPVKLLKIIEEVIEEYQQRDLDAPVAPLEEDSHLQMLHAEALSRKLDKKVRDLEDQKEQLRVITDAMPELIAEIDEFGHYKYVNEAYETWFHTSRNEIVGKKIEEVVGGEGFKIVQPYIDRALKGEEVTYEGYVSYNGGDQRYILARYIPHKIKQGMGKGLFSFIYDLTERKLAEEEKEQLLEKLRQAQKMEAIGHLAGGIAHDFNNLLAVILGYTELARRYDIEDKNGKLEGYLNQIHTASDRATGLIAQLQAFSRRTGKEIKFSIDIKPVVKEVVKLIEQTFPATILINLEMDESIPTIDVDPVQLHQVIMNLFVNARDAIEGHGQITVNLEHEQMNGVLCHSCQKYFNGDFVVLSIRDSGAGIEPKHQERIFEPFYTTKEAGKGTGMGLSLVHGIVHEVNGHIQLESEVGKGTTLRMFFPVSTLAEQPSEHNEADKGVGEIGDSGIRVMVVDDEVSIARYLEELLAMYGYQVAMFTDSRKALQALQNAPDEYDLIVSDQTMPVMTGLEMAREMLSLRPDLPVIICSGYSDSLSEDNINVAGVKTILQKPIDTNKLLQEMHHLLAH